MKCNRCTASQEIDKALGFRWRKLSWALTGSYAKLLEHFVTIMEQNRLTGTSLSTRTLFQLKCNGSLYFAEVKCELPAGTSLHAR